VQLLCQHTARHVAPLICSMCILVSCTAKCTALPPTVHFGGDAWFSMPTCMCLQECLGLFWGCVSDSETLGFGSVGFGRHSSVLMVYMLGFWCTAQGLD
jgi:hypothetical protein